MAPEPFPELHLIPLPLGLANPLPLLPLLALLAPAPAPAATLPIPGPPRPPLTGKEPLVDGGTLDLDDDGAGVSGRDRFGVALIDADSVSDASVDMKVISVSVPCRDERVDISCWSRSRCRCCLLNRLIDSAAGAYT
jgi:hypothetical protein